MVTLAGDHMKTGSDHPITVHGGPTAACRGGTILLLGSLLGAIFWSVPPLRKLSDNGPVVFFWPMSLWVIFPVGAWLGCWFPGRVRHRRALVAGCVGLVAGILVGLLLGCAVTACVHIGDLWGLISNRGSGGYASYRVSVLHNLQHQLGRLLLIQITTMPVVVMLWALWEARREPTAGPPSNLSEDRWAPRLGFTHLRIILVMAAGLSLFGLFFALVGRAGVGQSLLVAVVAFGTVFIGPWMGPIVNPGAATGGLALRETGLGAAVLVLSLVPFLLKGRADSPRHRAVAWCGYVTALLFWIYLGIICLGHSLG